MNQNDIIGFCFDGKSFIFLETLNLHYCQLKLRLLVHNSRSNNTIDNSLLNRSDLGGDQQKAHMAI